MPDDHPTTQTGGRRRAPAMSVDDRRESIIAATIPLLLRHGAGVTTSQIAEAAGIAEGTVFRAFRDKADLLTSCLTKAVCSDRETARIAEISGSLSLAERVAAAAETVAGYLDRMWALGQALRSGEACANQHAARGAGEHPHHPRQEAERQMEQVSQAIAALLEPDRDALRVPPERAARLLIGLIFADRLQGSGVDQQTSGTTQLVDMFLFGATAPDRSHQEG